MTSPSQKRAVDRYRQRLSERGLARFEVLGLEADRDLIRALARRLAQNDPQATGLRSEVAEKVLGTPRRTGRILGALRRSPLVGAEINVSREETSGRNIEL